MSRPGYLRSSVAGSSNLSDPIQQDYAAWKARVEEALSRMWPERKHELLGETDLHIVWRWQANESPESVARGLVRDLRELEEP